MSGEASRPVTAVIDPPGSVVIETKLHPPELFAEYVSRPRLIEQLDAASLRPLTVVTAPTGYGKSTLLAAWCEQATRAARCAWLSLDQSDNDPVVLDVCYRRCDLGEHFAATSRAANAWSLTRMANASERTTRGRAGSGVG
jgi:hypothetical protein